MNVLVIEDELSASKRITKMIKTVDPGIKILDIMESVEDSIIWLRFLRL